MLSVLGMTGLLDGILDLRILIIHILLGLSIVPIFILIENSISHENKFFSMLLFVKMRILSLSQQMRNLPFRYQIAMARSFLLLLLSQMNLVQSLQTISFQKMHHSEVILYLFRHLTRVSGISIILIRNFR